MPTTGDSDLETAELALLWAARETGLLEALLRETGSPNEAAAVSGVTERAARVTIDALVDLGFFERVEDGVEPTNRVLGLLATRDVRSIGQVPSALDQFDAFAALPTAMRRDNPERQPRSRTVQRTRHQLGASEAVDDATVRATVDAIHAANPDAERVLALADGPGRHARELADRGPAVTLLEGSAVGDVVEPLLAGGDVSLQTGCLPDLESGSHDLIFSCRRALAERGRGEPLHAPSSRAGTRPGRRVRRGGAAPRPLRYRSGRGSDGASHGSRRTLHGSDRGRLVRRCRPRRRVDERRSRHSVSGGCGRAPR